MIGPTHLSPLSSDGGNLWFTHRLAGYRFNAFSQPETSVRDRMAYIHCLKSLADASGYDEIHSPLAAMNTVISFLSLV